MGRYVGGGGEGSDDENGSEDVGASPGICVWGVSSTHPLPLGNEDWVCSGSCPRGVQVPLNVLSDAASCPTSSSVSVAYPLSSKVVWVGLGLDGGCLWRPLERRAPGSLW